MRNGYPAQYSALTSGNAIQCYKGGVKFSELQGIYQDPDKFQKLSSAGAVRAYQAGATFSDLEGMYQRRSKTLEKVISEDAVLRCYNTQVVTPEILNSLYDVDKDKFTALTSPNAVELYKTGTKFEDLQQLCNKNKDEFQVLTSQGAMEAYKVSPELHKEPNCVKATVCLLMDELPKLNSSGDTERQKLEERIASFYRQDNPSNTKEDAASFTSYVVYKTSEISLQDFSSKKKFIDLVCNIVKDGINFVKSRISEKTPDIRVAEFIKTHKELGNKKITPSSGPNASAQQNNRSQRTY